MSLGGVGWAIGAAVVGGKIEHDAAKKQAKKTEEAAEKVAESERAAEGEKAARQRRQQVKQARIARADIQNVAAVSGQSGGSAAISGAQNVTGTAASNIGAINKAKAGADATSGAQQNLFAEQIAPPSSSAAVGGFLKSNAGSIGKGIDALITK